MMGLKVKPNALREIIEEIDEDWSDLLEFGEFCQLAAKFVWGGWEGTEKRAQRGLLYDKEDKYRESPAKADLNTWVESPIFVELILAIHCSGRISWCIE